ncbi:MAG: dUTPase [Christensenellales bacterium]|jgi:dimeric dUTPase (all-alpha-NTP-PPase superfamily)
MDTLKKDKLDIIFEMQKQLDTDIENNRNLKDIPADKWIQKQTLAILSELAELLDEVNFKWWKNPKEINQANIKEELVDILHFFVGMCLRAGMTPDELFNIYVGKNKENFDRQYGKSSKKGYEIDSN